MSEIETAARSATHATGIRAKNPVFYRAENQIKVPNNSDERERQRQLAANVVSRVSRTRACARPHARPWFTASDRDPSLRFKFELDRRHRRDGHVVESQSRGLRSDGDFHKPLGQGNATATRAQHRDYVSREVRRLHVKDSVRRSSRLRHIDCASISKRSSGNVRVDMRAQVDATKALTMELIPPEDTVRRRYDERRRFRQRCDREN